MPNAIGIDWGTTNSAAFVMLNGHVEVIHNQEGHELTPSVVAFTDVERLVGIAAVNQAANNATNTIYSVKRLMGRQFDDPEVQQYIKNWPVEVVKGEGGRPFIVVEYLGQRVRYSPEAIAAMVLAKLRGAAERFLVHPVTDAVITVPAYFKEAQKLAVKEAAQIAGLKVLRILAEPSAAALAYGVERLNQIGRTTLVFDLGGGTFDVSIMRVSENKKEFGVLAINGDPHLGGDDFDQLLMEHCIAEFERKNGKNKNIRSNNGAMRRLRTACEFTKRQLTSGQQSKVEVDTIVDGLNLSLPVSRARFEDICMDKIESTIPRVEMAIRDAKLEKSGVDHILLVGGSARIPLVKTLLKKFFDGKLLNDCICPEHTVARGAAILAATLSGDRSDSLTDISLIDVTPLSLGIETGLEGSLTVQIPRNTKIPADIVRMYTTCHDNQTSVEFKVYEGERRIAIENHLLGSFRLTDIPMAPKGVPQFKVTFRLDEDAILNVSAIDVATGNNNAIRVDKGRPSKEEIRRMIRVAEEHQRQDEEHDKKLTAKNALEKYCNRLLRDIERPEITCKLPVGERSQLKDMAQNAKEYVNGNFEGITIDRCQKILEAIKEAWEPLVTKWYADGIVKEDNKKGKQPGHDAMANQLYWHDIFIKTTVALLLTIVVLIVYDNLNKKR